MDQSAEPLPSKAGLNHKRKLRATIAVLIDRLMDFERSRIQRILKEVHSSSSGTKAELRYLIEQSIKLGRLTADGIEENIFDWEPWSHRHCYFIKIHKDDLDNLRSESFVKKKLTEAHILNQLNATKVFHIPTSLKVDFISYKEDKLTVELIAPVYTYERREAEDKFDDNSQMIWQAKQRKTSRKLYLIEVSLRTGKGFLSIPSVQKGQTYSKEFFRLEKLLKTAFGISSFEITPIDSAIEKLLENEVSISNSLQVQFGSGHKVQIKSPGKKEPIFEDPKMKNLKRIVQKEHYSEGGFYYAEELVKPEFRYKIYDDHRLGIFSDLDEEEFRNVIKLILENI